MKKYGLLQVVVCVGFAITFCSAESCYGRRRGHLSGNVTLGFLFSYHGFNDSSQKCTQDVPNFENIQLLEAATMVLRNTSASGLTFGLNSWDTCSLRSAAVEASIAYLTDQMNSFGDQENSPINLCSASISKPGIVASLENGGQGEAVSRLMNDALVPLISFASSQSSLTKDGQFPYFLRTSPSDDFEATGLVMLLQRMNWSYVTTINLDTVEDKAALQTFSQSANRGAICISSSWQFSLDSSNEDMDHLISNIASNPSASVVIVFASSSSMEKLIGTIQRAGDSAVALRFVFSHRALLGVTPNIARLHGALSFRSPLPMVEETFDAYFKLLTPDTVDPAHNPWFADYWQRKYQCNLHGSAYRDNCSSIHADMHKSSYKRHPYVSNVIDAVRAYTTSAQTSYNLNCSQVDQSTPCDSLTGHRQEILSSIRQVNFTKDNGQHFAFLPSGDIYYSKLEIVNYKMDTDGNFQFEPVGHVERGELSLDLNKLELMSDQSVCGPPCVDPACRDTGLLPGDTMVYMSGDVILGGFFSIHEWNTSKAACGSLNESGVKRLEAMMYALDKINNDSTILPGITLGMDGFDTCTHPDRAGHQALQLVGNGHFGQSGSGQRPAGELTEHVYGIVGPNGDEECQLVNGVLNIYSMPMISYAATSVSLSNTFVYKNFARTVFTDSAVGIALLQAISNKQWNYVQALNSNTASGRLFTSVLQQTGPRMGVCLTSSQIIPSAENVDQMDEVFRTLTTRPEAKVVFIAATNHDMRVILKEYRMRNLFGQYYLILASEWSTDPSLQQDFADIAPGITFISEGKRSYPDFKKYFSSRNPSKNQRNPWFAEYWANKFQCNLADTPSVYAEDCSGLESLTPDDGEDRRIAQTVDSVYAMARAISSLHDYYCQGESHVCPEMITAPGDELFQQITSRDSRFSSINDGYIVGIGAYGDVTPDFEIFNVQRTANGTQKNVKVGVYRNYFYQTLEENITVYKKEGESFIEVTDAKSVCEGVCNDCKKVEKVTTAEISGGDVWIGGLFELHEPASDHLQCKDELIPYNVQLLEAFLFAVDHVNLDSAILPELKLGAIAFDSCGNVDRAHREVLNFVSGTVEYRSGYPRDKAVVVGIVGGQTSDTTVAVAKALEPLGVNQISYAATTAELSDASEFPYFLRTVPSDDKQASAIVDLLLEMNWQYVSVVFSDNAYGTDLWNGIKQKLAGTPVCVAMSLKLLATYNEKDYENVAQQLQINPQAKVVLLLTSDVGAMQILEAAERISVADLQWIGTDTWGSRDYIIEKAQVTSQGALILRFQQAPVIQAFKDYFTNLQLYTNRRNPWWMTFWEDTFKCNIYGSSRYNVSCPWQLDIESVYKQATEVSYILDAVQLFATGLHTAMLAKCPGITRYICDDLATAPGILHSYIQEATILRSDGSVFKLDENGDGESSYDVLRIKVNGTEDKPSYVKVGNWTSGNLNLDSTLAHISSSCVGRCAECYMSKQDVPVQVPGSLQMVGLFATHAPGDHSMECGELRSAGIVNLEAMLFATDQINADPTILRGITLGVTAFDTCTRGFRGVRGLSSVFSGTTPGQDSSQHSWSLIAGVIGGENNEVTLTTATLTKQYKYAQISYGVGTVSENLSNLLRTGPAIQDQVMAVIQLLQHFQWQYVSLISSLSEHRVHQRNIFINEVTSHGICIGTQGEISTKSLIPALLQNIYETSDQNVVVLFTDKEDTLHLAEAVKILNNPRHLTWLIAFNDHLENELLGSSFLGAFLVNNEPKLVPQFENYFASLTASSNQRNPLFQEFIRHEYNCSTDFVGNFSAECSKFVNTTLHVAPEDYALSTNVINAVYAIAHGVQDTRDRHCNDTPGLCAAFVGLNAEELQLGIKETSFTSLDGSSVNFDNGTSVQQFTILNYKEINDSSQFLKVGAWISGSLSIQASRVSFYSLQGRLTTTPVLSQCHDINQCTCPDIKPTIVSKSPTNPSVESTTSTAATCTTFLVPTTATSESIKYTSISGLKSSWFVILMIIAVIGILLAVTMIVIFLFYWKQPITQAMSPFLHITLLSGVILIYLLNPIFAAPPSVMSCALQRIVPGIAFAFCQVAIFMLTMRLSCTSKQVYVVSGSMPTLLNTSSQVGCFVILMALEFVIAVEWLILRPPVVVAGVTPESFNGNSTLGICAYGASTLGALTYVYVLLVLTIIAVIPAWKKRDMISSLELFTLLLMVIGSTILLIVWALVELFGSQSYHQPGMTIVATVKATLFLVLTVPRAKAVVFKRDSFNDSASMNFGDTGAELAGVRSSISEIPAPEDIEDDVSTVGSQIQLSESMVTSKV